jgi:hypothetical protein
MVNKGKFKLGQECPNKTSFITCWVNKFGQEEASSKLLSYKEKQSIANTGTKNNMYGKPAPQGSGNGWSGWYNSWFFRSLNELAFMVRVIERFNFSWVSAEKKELRIPYIDYKNSQRTYTADFLLNNKYLVECKPKKLFNSPQNLEKKKAALLYCKEKNFIYKQIETEKLTYEEINNLIELKKLKFTDKYNEKFKQFNSNPTKES